VGARRKHFDRPCEQCNEPFLPRSAEQRFCSAACKLAGVTVYKKFCVNGHPRTPESIRRGNKGCLICHRNRQVLERKKAGARVRPKLVTCRHGHDVTALGSRDAKGGCVICHRDQEKARMRAKGVRPYIKPLHCPSGHERIEANMRRGRHAGECAICHRLRSRKMADPQVMAYAGILAADPCSYCGEPGGVLDHIVPRSSYGPDAWDNLTSACHSCNSRKRTKSLLRFLCDRVPAQGEAATATEIMQQKSQPAAG
jgi:5-methylcytosine-specific restriction endonuclease McrA